MERPDRNITFARLPLIREHSGEVGAKTAPTCMLNGETLVYETNANWRTAGGGSFRLPAKSVAAPVHKLSMTHNISGNPSQISNQITSMVHSVTHRIMETHESLKKLGLSHTVYLSGLILYTVMGGLIFKWLDGDESDRQIDSYNHRCLEVIDAEYRRVAQQCNSSSYSENCTRIIAASLRTVHLCHVNCDKNCTKLASLPLSDLGNAIVFAASIYTTIGYGTTYPYTLGAKTFVIVYSMFGIPYFLASIAAIGRFLHVIFMRICLWIRAKIETCKRRCKKDPETPLPSARRQTRLFPFLLGCIVAWLYLLLLSAAIEWFTSNHVGGELDLFHSLYFVVQSVTLVGFGDVVPRDHYIILYHSGFMLLGICLMSMCFFILQETFIERTASATNRITVGVQSLSRKFSRDITPLHRRRDRRERVLRTAQSDIGIYNEEKQKPPPTKRKVAGKRLRTFGRSGLTWIQKQRTFLSGSPVESPRAANRRSRNERSKSYDDVLQNTIDFDSPKITTQSKLFHLLPNREEDHAMGISSALVTPEPSRQSSNEPDNIV